MMDVKKLTRQTPSLTPFTIVIKLGSSSIIDETTHQPLLSLLSAIVETVTQLKENGHRVVLVSSGAIAVGLKRMEMKSRPKSLAAKQALAAVGQGRLIALWDNLFGQLGQPIAQILLTRGDLSDRTRYLNAGNTIAELLSLGVIPIVNENDTVSVSEIKFGDNDTLSAITASMINADFLFLLTDVDGLYTSNPRKDPSAQRIDVVDSVTEVRSKVSTKTLGSHLGTGGMETKLIAADIATAAGVTTIVASSQNPKVVFDIIHWTIQQSVSSITTTTSTTKEELVHRPPHTSFTPSPMPLRSLKSWTFHTLNPAGSIIIDHGAHAVLSRRHSGGRLLPAGVIDVQGNFAGGQAVRILVIKKGKEGEDEGTTTTTSASFNSIPPTPTLLLSRRGSMDNTGLPEKLMDADSPPRTVHHEVEHQAIPEDQLVEVGRGLANYNSVEIMKVKGQQSGMIAELLGYADSEYVVENITIRVLPLP